MIVCQSTHSAHSALQLTLNLNGNNFGRSGIVAKPKIIFNEAKKIEFQSHFKNNLVKFCSVESYDNFKNCLFESALESKMVEKPKIKSINKPWFDRGCH